MVKDIKWLAEDKLLIELDLTYNNNDYFNCVAEYNFTDNIIHIK